MPLQHAELAGLMKRKFGIQVHPSTVCRFVKKLGLSRKLIQVRLIDYF